LSALIENVLDFSRIEQGRKQYEFEPTDMLRLLRNTKELMEPYAAERGIELKLDLPPAWDPLNAPTLDGKAIQQALINLIDNALKHSANGQVVTLGLQPQIQQNTRIVLWVEDQGEGIPREEHARIFERFYRCGSELRRKTQGVGIGLSIVKHIVEAHRGIIQVQSEPEKGSRFTIELPALSEAAETGSAFLIGSLNARRRGTRTSAPHNKS
jgi:signal transduction histidine kinase